MQDEIRNAVAQTIRHRDRFTVADFDVSPGANGQRTKVATYKANRPLALENGSSVDLAIMAFEQKTAAGGAPETFNLAHDLVKSGATSDDLIVFVNGAETEPAAVDYANDTVDVATAANDEVGFFYASGKQAQVQIQKTAPNGTHETLWTGLANLLHHKDHNEEPVTLDLSMSFLQSVIPTDWTLDVYVDAPYVARFEKDIDGDGAAEKAHNALVGIPYLGGRGRIDGLGKAVRGDTARR